MKLFDRYIIRELLSPFLFGLSAFTTIIAGSSVLFPLVKRAMTYGISFGDTFQIFIYRIPGILSVTLPMAMLLSTIVVFSRFSSDLEITAFRSSGIGLYRLVVPVMALGLLVSLVNIVFNELVVPRANNSAETLYLSLKDQGPKLEKNVNITEYDPDGRPTRIINVREVKDEKLQDVTIAEYISGSLARVIRAKQGRWDLSGGWYFFDGIMHDFTNEDSRNVMVIEFAEEYIDMNINPLDVKNREKDVEELTVRQLKERIAFKHRTGERVTQDEVHYYMKFSLPFACLIFTLVGICVGVRPHHRRSSSAVGVGMSLVIIIAYYVLYSLGMGLGLSGLVHPMIAGWLPNVVVGSVSMGLLGRLARL
ncbi:YjgP/YjgQ family permease [bacterium]|jgi:lipopolysaccharide export system permease protein|nr:YjgP/YjgQ family permease [bacterium]